MIPRFRPYIGKEEILAALRYSRGNIGKYEKSFAEKFGCRYGVMFPYGRSGLYSIFKVWELNKAEIICPAYTCVVVSNAIVLSGNIPVFVDCETGSFNMSYDGIKNAVTERTRAIIVTHLFGYPMDVNRIERIVKDAEHKYGHKIYVIQDAGHSFGARWEGRLVTCSGDAAIFSSGISKMINSISGGMVTTNDKDLYERVKKYRDENFVRQSPVDVFKKFLFLLIAYIAFNGRIYGLVHRLEKNGLLDGIVKYYDEERIYFPKDWNLLPGEMEARVGLAQLNKYDRIVSERISNSKKYIQRFKTQNGIDVMPLAEGATYSHFVALVEDREGWLREYRRKGIQLGILIEYAIPYFKAYAGYKNTEYPIAKYYSQHTINFPVFQHIKHENA